MHAPVALRRASVEGTAGLSVRAPRAPERGLHIGVAASDKWAVAALTMTESRVQERTSEHQHTERGDLSAKECAARQSRWEATAAVQGLYLPQGAWAHPP